MTIELRDSKHVISMSNPSLTDKTLAQLGVNDLGCKW